MPCSGYSALHGVNLNFKIGALQRLTQTSGDLIQLQGSENPFNYQYRPDHGKLFCVMQYVSFRRVTTQLADSLERRNSLYVNPICLQNPVIIEISPILYERQTFFLSVYNS